MISKNTRISRKDVAKRAGVSESTVSYVLNNYKYVSKDKRERVLKAVEELNYKPNAAARSLKMNKTNHIIFIVDQLTNENFGHLVNEMEKYIYDKEYLITLCTARNDKQFVSLINSRQFDGIIISSYILTDETITALGSQGTPIILFENRVIDLDMPNIVRINTGLYAGSKLAMNHLIEKGRRHILFIDKLCNDENINYLDLKEKAYRDTLEENGITLDDRYIINNCKTKEQIINSLVDRVKSGLKIDGIFGRNDRFAVLGMDTIQRLGYNVPGDVSVIGFDNASMDEYLKPSLTSVMVRRNEVAYKSIELLCNMIDKKIVDSIKFEPQLIEREST